MELFFFYDCDQSELDNISFVLLNSNVLMCVLACQNKCNALPELHPSLKYRKQTLLLCRMSNVYNGRLKENRHDCCRYSQNAINFKSNYRMLS